MDFGAIINAGPPTVRSFGLVTLQVSPAHGFRFLRGQTFVTYRAPSATAQLTVRPEGVQHLDDYSIRAHVPDMVPGAYECLVTSGADLARTAAPIRHAGNTGSGPSAPRDYGIALDAPQPQSAYEGDTVSIRALPGTGFEFDASANFLTFGAPGATARFTLQPGAIRRIAPDEIQFELPPIQSGTYAIWARSAGNDAQTRMPIRHLGARPFGQAGSGGGQSAGPGGGRFSFPGMGPGMGGSLAGPQPVSSVGAFVPSQSLQAPPVTRSVAAFAPQSSPTISPAPATRGQRAPLAVLTKRTLGTPTISPVAGGPITKTAGGVSLPSSATGTTPFGPQNSGPSHDFAGVPPDEAIPDSFDLPDPVEPEKPGEQIGTTPRDAFPAPPNPYAGP